MKIRKVVIGVLAVVIGVPAVLILGIVVTLAALNRTSGSIVSSGEKREYLLHVPQSYDRTRPTPLIISMHAAALWPANQMNTSRWNQLADKNGFIVVYPSGTGFPRIWHVDDGPGLEADVRFISDLIDTLAATYNIDPRRIYADGLSNGGGMAFVLSCKLSERIAAVGTVAAAQTLPFDWCKESRPVPVIVFHGTADPIVPYAGGTLGDRFNPVKPNFPPVREWTASWARKNLCRGDPTASAVAPDVERIEYTDCAQDAGVVLYTVKGGGHSWPGGKPLPEWHVGPTSNSISATGEMWTFFRGHPLTPP